MPKWVKYHEASSLVQGGPSEVLGGSQRFRKTKRIHGGLRRVKGAQRGVEEGCKWFKRGQKESRRNH